MPIPVQCSHCEAILKLKDDAIGTLGKKMRCPKCSEVFVMKRYRAPKPAEEVVDEYDYEDAEAEEADEYEERPRRSSSRGRSSASRGRGSKPKKAAPGENSTIKTVMSVLSCAVIVFAIGFKAWRRFGGRNAPAPIPVVQPIANDQTPMPSGGHAATPTGATTPAAGVAISDTEYEAFAKSLELRIAQQKGQGFAAVVNVDKLLARGMQGLELNPSFVVGFKTGAVGAFRQNLATQLDTNLADDGHYRFVRMHTVETRKRLLFRMGGTAGTNYHDLEVEKGANGHLEIVDMHVSIAGENLSETLRRVIVLAAVSQKGSFLKTLTGQYSDFEKSLPLINQFNAHKNAGQFPQALTVFKQFPPSLQADKTFALTRVIIAAKANEQEYLAAMNDFRKLFPTDACIDFMAVDYHTLRKEFDQALAALDRFEKSLGGDVYLNSIRADLYGEQNKWDEAKKAIASVIAADPTLTSAVYTQAGIGLAHPDYKLVLNSLLILKRQHRIDLSGIATTPEYAGFVKSPEYQEWLKSM